MDVQPANPEDQIISLKVIYRGRVQGVGFRYQTCRVADRFNISGSVKNLSDGSVELIAQGEKKTVDSFIKSVNQTLSNNIMSSVETSIPIQPNLKPFQIQY
jgi:acylphosphatase